MDATLGREVGRLGKFSNLMSWIGISRTTHRFSLTEWHEQKKLNFNHKVLCCLSKLQYCISSLPLQPWPGLVIFHNQFLPTPCIELWLLCITVTQCYLERACDIPLHVSPLLQGMLHERVFKKVLFNYNIILLPNGRGWLVLKENRIANQKRCSGVSLLPAFSRDQW